MTGHFTSWWRHQMETYSALLASFVRGIHRWPVNSPYKGQWRGALLFSLICAWTNGWVNNREAGDLSRHRSLILIKLWAQLCFLCEAVYNHASSNFQSWTKFVRSSSSKINQNYCLLLLVKVLFPRCSSRNVLLAPKFLQSMIDLNTRQNTCVSNCDPKCRRCEIDV